MADVDVSLYDEIALDEDTGVCVVLLVSLYDSAAVAESVGVTKVLTKSVYDSVAVAEYSIYATRLWTDPRTEKNPRAPVASLTATMGELIRQPGVLRAPAPTMVGTFGSVLVEMSPVAVLSGIVISPVSMALNRKAPFPNSIAGIFGANLAKRSPVAEISASMNQYSARLDKKSPFPTLSAELSSSGSLSLDKTAPVGRITATGSSPVSLTLSRKAPVATIIAAIIDTVYMTLDSKAPAAYMEYEGGDVISALLALDATAPAAVMADAAGAGIGAGAVGSVITDALEFDSYILRYVRP